MTYLKPSNTVEESTSYALANGFIYYMDERDKEWLDKNNEEATGEGTRAQGSISGTSSHSGRSAKSKGKDSEALQPVAMSEDEFELVVAVFEKVTHEKTELLHHVGPLPTLGSGERLTNHNQGLEQGSPFPPFTNYQDTFSVPLQPSLFALYAVPNQVPQSPQLLRLAKTRAQQATYSDKTVHLPLELSTAAEHIKGVVQRELAKKEVTVHRQALWDKRFGLMGLKRKFSALGSMEDDELFYDKECVFMTASTYVQSLFCIVDCRLMTTSSRLSLTFHQNGEYSPIPQEPVMKPKERQQLIQKQIDQELAVHEAQDHSRVIPSQLVSQTQQSPTRQP